jgi:hypothetical protein
MKTISTFIFAHKQEIILEYKKNEKFKNLPEVKYVLVGKNNYDLVDNMEDVIIAQKFDGNIEDYPRFTSYTGWYILWKNNLIKTDYINLFEYDINVRPNMSGLFTKIQKSDFDFIGYLPMGIKEPCYLLDRRWTTDMIESIKKNYNLDMDNFFTEFIKNNPNSNWSSTSNSTFTKEHFEKYMCWFENIFVDLKNSEFPGHAHERSISFYYFLNKLKVAIFPGFIEHFQLNSHETSPLESNRFDKLFNNLL